MAFEVEHLSHWPLVVAAEAGEAGRLQFLGMSCLVRQHFRTSYHHPLFLKVMTS